MARKKPMGALEAFLHAAAWKRKNDDEREEVRCYMRDGLGLREIKKLMPTVSESVIRNHMENIFREEL